MTPSARPRPNAVLDVVGHTRRERRFPRGSGSFPVVGMNDVEPCGVAPALFLGLVGYFGWNATQGDRGLQSYALRQQQLRSVQAELSRAEQERDVLERRVSGLRTQRLDPDTLDERARAMLNAAEPSDIVVMYGPGKRLFGP